MKSLFNPYDYLVKNISSKGYFGNRKNNATQTPSLDLHSIVKNTVPYAIDLSPIMALRYVRCTPLVEAAITIS
jgi:hypothetical protein